MSKVTFSTTTALLGSGVRCRLQDVAQSVIALRLSTHNAHNTKAHSPKALKALKALKAHNTKAHSPKALNALNSNSRSSTSLRQKTCRTVNSIANLNVQLKTLRRLPRQHEGQQLGETAWRR